MSYGENLLYSEMLDFWRRTRQAAQTRVLAELTGYSERGARRLLAKLEVKGEVQRRGQRGGWLPAMG